METQAQMVARLRRDANNQAQEMQRRLQSLIADATRLNTALAQGSNELAVRYELAARNTSIVMHDEYLSRDAARVDVLLGKMLTMYDLARHLERNAQEDDDTAQA